MNRLIKIAILAAALPLASCRIPSPATYTLHGGLQAGQTWTIYNSQAQITSFDVNSYFPVHISEAGCEQTITFGHFSCDDVGDITVTDIRSHLLFLGRINNVSVTYHQRIF
jgi:hypothetical protein